MIAGRVHDSQRDGPIYVAAMALDLGQLDAGSILVVASLLLACGSGGLLVVRLSNPRLKGLGWLGAAFASGGMGAILLTFSQRLPPFLGVILSDLLVLLAIVLLHVAMLEMHGGRSLWPKLGSSLVAVQFAGYCSLVYGHSHGRDRISLFGVIISIQLGQTVLLLIRGARRGGRLPAWFTAAVLSALMAVNLYRSAVLIFVLRNRPPGAAATLQTFTFLVFIATAMGIAFGFFWMTTAKLSHELEMMASTDPLTRIYNRRVFREWCEREYERSRRSGSAFSLLMMDLDHFKEINDRYGHKGGDDVLCAVVETMQDSVRGIDILGRWGGEEFVALLPGTTMESALIVAQRVRANIEKLMLESGEGAMRMTISLGVATLRGREDELDAIFLRADQALYLAKESGRNRVLSMP
jgi:diguanylate cyclase (GGDEF)-like protein